MFNRRVFSRRSLLTGTAASFVTAGLGTLANTFTTFDSKKSQTTNDGCDGEVLGQDPFRYPAHRHLEFSCLLRRLAQSSLHRLRAFPAI